MKELNTDVTEQGEIFPPLFHPMQLNVQVLLGILNQPVGVIPEAEATPRATPKVHAGIPL